MSKTLVFATCLNWVLLALLAVSIVGFLSFQNVYGLFLACITAFIMLGVFKKRTLGYFAAAAWGLAAYQLAKQGYEFNAIKSYVMLIGFLVIPISLYLHEILAKPHNKNAQKCVKTQQDDPNIPQ